MVNSHLAGGSTQLANLNLLVYFCNYLGFVFFTNLFSQSWDITAKTNKFLQQG